jgi:VanZ family protein
MNSSAPNSRPPLAWLWWLPALGWAGFIFYMSSLPSDKLPRFDIPHLDKVVHGMLYGLLAYLFFAALRFGHTLRFSFCVVIGLLLASLYGVTDEIHQISTPGRSCDVMDWVADTLGASMIFFARSLRPKETSSI